MVEPELERSPSGIAGQEEEGEGQEGGGERGEGERYSDSSENVESQSFSQEVYICIHYIGCSNI